LWYGGLDQEVAMSMKLIAPDLKCAHCKGVGARARDLKLVLNGAEMSSPTKVLLHCGCLNPKLKELHAELDTAPVLKAWPWEELKGVTTPKAEDGPEPWKVESPFPIPVAPTNIPTKPVEVKPSAAEEPKPTPVTVKKPRKRGKN
jgi:hypothetical protein